MAAHNSPAIAATSRQPMLADTVFVRPQTFDDSPQNLAAGGNTVGASRAARQPSFPLPDEILRLGQQRPRVSTHPQRPTAAATASRIRRYATVDTNPGYEYECEESTDNTANGNDWLKHFESVSVSGRPPAGRPTPQATLLVNLGARLRTILHQGRGSNHNDSESNGGYGSKSEQRRKSAYDPQSRESRKTRNYRTVSLASGDDGVPIPTNIAELPPIIGQRDRIARRSTSAVPSSVGARADGTNAAQAPAGHHNGNGLLASLSALRASCTWSHVSVGGAPADNSSAPRPTVAGGSRTVANEFDSLLSISSDKTTIGEDDAQLRVRAVSTGSAMQARQRERAASAATRGRRTLYEDRS